MTSVYKFEFMLRLWILLSLLNKKAAIENPALNCRLHHLISDMRSNYKATKSLVESARAEGFISYDEDSRVYSITNKGREYKEDLKGVLQPFYKAVIEGYHSEPISKFRRE